MVFIEQNGYLVTGQRISLDGQRCLDRPDYVILIRPCLAAKSHKKNDKFIPRADDEYAGDVTDQIMTTLPTNLKISQGFRLPENQILDDL